MSRVTKHSGEQKLNKSHAVVLIYNSYLTLDQSEVLVAAHANNTLCCVTVQMKELWLGKGCDAVLKPHTQMCDGDVCHSSGQTHGEVSRQAGC